MRRRGREIASLCVLPRKSARDEKLPPIFSPTKRVGLAPVVTEESSDSASEGPNGEESTVLTRTRQQPAKHQKALAKSPTTSVDRLLSTRANKAVLDAHHSPRVQIIFTAQSLTDSKTHTRVSSKSANFISFVTSI